METKDVMLRIEEVRKWSGMTAPHFSEKIGVVYSSYAAYRSLKREPSLALVLNVLTAFKPVSPDYLLFGEGRMMRPGYADDGLPEEQFLPDEAADEIHKFRERMDVVREALMKADEALAHYKNLTNGNK